MLRHEKCFHNVLCLSEAKGMDIKMNISLLEPIGISQTMIEDFSKGLKEAGHSFTYYETKTTDVEELKRRSAGQDIVMIANTPYPDEVVRACDPLQMIAVAFTGIVHVGLEACKEKGIIICNCAGYSDTSVSELVLGMTINVMRNISACDTSVRSGKTSLGLAGTEIEGKTMGIIGCGQIGFQTAKLLMYLIWNRQFLRIILCFMLRTRCSLLMWHSSPGNLWCVVPEQNLIMCMHTLTVNQLMFAGIRWEDE